MRGLSLLTCLALGVALRPATAQMLDTLEIRVDGRDVRMVTAGRGSPTVVFEAGFASTHRMWRDLMAALALTNQVVAYDRAGLGGSDPGPLPRSSRTIAQELRLTLRAADLKPPFLLVGHSAGGLHVRVFASLFPDETLGLVLVDPVPEDFYARAQREQPAVFAHFDSLDRADQATLPDGVRREKDAWDTSLTEARWSDGRFPGPVLVLSSARPELQALGAIWTDEHRRWAASADRRTYVLVPGSGHSIHREAPDAVLAAIRELLGAR